MYAIAYIMTLISVICMVLGSVKATEAMTDGDRFIGVVIILVGVAFAFFSPFLAYGYGEDSFKGYKVCTSCCQLYKEESFCPKCGEELIYSIAGKEKGVYNNEILQRPF